MRSPFDSAEILTRVDGDYGLLADLVGLLQQECERYLPRLAEAIEVRDRPTAEHAAHQLKGSLSHFATPLATDLARRLEEMAAGGNLDGAAELHAELVAAVDVLMPALTIFAEGERA